MKTTKATQTNVTRATYESAGLDPTDQDLLNAEAYIDQARQLFGANPVILPPKDRQLLSKPSAMDEKYVPKILEIARRRGVSIPRVDLDAVRQSLVRAERFEPLVARADVLASLASDVVLKSRSDAWTAAVVVYGVLAQMARADSELALDLAPVKLFFSRIRRTPPKKPETTNTDPNASTKGKKGAKGKDGAGDKSSQEDPNVVNKKPDPAAGAENASPT
jgi:hypothetical protein